MKSCWTSLGRCSKGSCQWNWRSLPLPRPQPCRSPRLQMWIRSQPAWPPSSWYALIPPITRVFWICTTPWRSATNRSPWRTHLERWTYRISGTFPESGPWTSRQGHGKCWWTTSAPFRQKHSCKQKSAPTYRCALWIYISTCRPYHPFLPCRLAWMERRILVQAYLR